MYSCYYTFLVRVMIVISSLRTGGAERTLSWLANKLVAHGHTVRLCTFTPLDEHTQYSLDEGVTYQPLNAQVFRQHKTYTKCMETLKLIFKLRQVIKNHPADVVLSALETVNVVTLIACHRYAPCVISERTHLLHASWLFRLLRWIFYRWASTLVVQTETTAQYFRRRISNMRIFDIPFVCVIPNGIIAFDSALKSPKH